MLRPTNKKGVERIIRTVNYLAKFQHNMSIITQHIWMMLQKDVAFEWSYKQEKTVMKIERILTSEPGPVMTYFDVNKSITASCIATI